MNPRSPRLLGAAGAAAILALALISLPSNAQNPLPRRADQQASPGRRRLGGGRHMAKPMDVPAAAAAPAPDSLLAWAIPAKGDSLRLTWMTFGPRGDSTSNTQRLEIRTSHDPAGRTVVAYTSVYESVTPDSEWLGKDLNGDGEPDVVVKRQVRERPVTGQWIDIFGIREGRVRLWLTRDAARVPKSLMRLKGEDSPVILALEPHAENWPLLRGDPPARSMLLQLRDTTVVDISARHPEWFAPATVATGLDVERLEAEKRYNQDWAEDVLEHVWGLLGQGRRDEARAYFEGHVTRARDASGGWAGVLESERAGLESMWR